MLTRLDFSTPVAALLCALALAGCGRSADRGPAPLNDEDGVLGYVPADSPYVFAAAQKMPDAVLDKLEASADSIYSAYETVISASMNDLAGEMQEDGDEEQARLIVSLAAEFVELLQTENLRAAGVPRGAQTAVYGVGLLPVFRLELSNPVAFEAKIAEIEASAGGEMSSGSVDGTPYRYVGDTDMRIVLAVVDGYFVSAVVPPALSDENLAGVLGVDKPARSIAETGELAALAERFALTAYGIGFLDVGRIAATFIEAPDGIDAELLALMGHDPASVSDVCRSEIRGMADVAPRVVTGYTSVTPREIASNTVFELRSDLAAGLGALAAPVPGMGVDHGGLFSFGVSVDLLAAREFVQQRVDALEAAPFECEYFAGAQAAVEQARQSLSQPVPPIVYGSRGFLAVVDAIEGLDFEGRQPPEEVDARLLVASDNAEGLLAMGALFSPELAALDIQPDGRPVALPVPQLTQMFDSAYVALTQDALGLSVGHESPEGLADLMASEPVEPAPTLSIRLDGRRYYEFMSEAVRAGNADGSGTDGGDGEAMPEDVQIAVSQIIAGVGDAVERMGADVVLTPRGIEVPATVTLGD